MRANENALREETATAAWILKIWSNSIPDFDVQFFEDYWLF